MRSLLAGWIAVNTHFGDVRQPFRDFAAAQFIQQKAAESSARVLIFPESVVPRWSEATEVFWRRNRLIVAERAAKYSPSERGYRPRPERQETTGKD